MAACWGSRGLGAWPGRRPLPATPSLEVRACLAAGFSCLLPLPALFPKPASLLPSPLLSFSLPFCVLFPGWCQRWAFAASFSLVPYSIVRAILLFSLSSICSSVFAASEHSCCSRSPRPPPAQPAHPLPCSKRGASEHHCYSTHNRAAILCVCFSQRGDACTSVSTNVRTSPCPYGCLHKPRWHQAPRATCLPGTGVKRVCATVWLVFFVVVVVVLEIYMYGCFLCVYACVPHA